MAVEQERTARRGKTIISIPFNDLKILGKVQDKYRLLKDKI